MFRCNLAVLLAQRSLRISKVSKDTGISRTTLTSLSNNTSQGIQFDTLATLCSYLRITPGDLFAFSTANVKFKIVDCKGSYILTEHETNATYKVDYNITVEDGYWEASVDMTAELECSGWISEPPTDEDDEDNEGLEYRLDNITKIRISSYPTGKEDEDYVAVDRALAKLDKGFISDLISELKDALADEIGIAVSSDCDIKFDWSLPQ